MNGFYFRYHERMEVRLFPNSRRPGIGQKPRREAQRPLLPQHARHCPVLEAGSSLGYLCYPPLESNESFHLEYAGDGKYNFTYFLRGKPGEWEPIFRVATTLPVNGVGMLKQEVTLLGAIPTLTRESALRVSRAFISPEDLGTPPGGLSLRGSTNFQTSTGWDTVYAPIFNQIERPIAPMLVVRVETDWYTHETEFRYVMEPGEGISCQHNMPIGQVFFMPREEITMRSCTDEEVAVLQRSMQEFYEHKAANKVTTPYGLEYSPHYLRKTRESPKP